MASKTILMSIIKLNGQNWHTWSKETEAYLTMEEFWELIDPTEPIPTSSASLKAEHKKDTPSTQMNLRQCFYLLSHDPTISVIPFTNQVLTVVHQLESIKPNLRSTKSLTNS